MKERNKLGAWFTSKFHSLVAHKSSRNDRDFSAQSRKAIDGPLNTAAARQGIRLRRHNQAKQQAASTPVPAAEQVIDDDCSQGNRASSDQTLAEATTVARYGGLTLPGPQPNAGEAQDSHKALSCRLDEHVQSRLSDELASRNNPPDAAAAAASHMATLRDLLVTHIGKAYKPRVTWSTDGIQGLIMLRQSE